MTTIDPAHSLQRVRHVAADLSQLARLGTSSMHAILSRIHDLCDAIGLAERDFHRDEIVTELSEVRRGFRQSGFVARLQDWPRGYPGDFETVEWLLHGRPRIPESEPAYWIEYASLQSPIAQQHRNKVQAQTTEVETCLLNNPKARILILAAGSAPELRRLAPLLASRPDATVVVNDADPEALDFCREHIIQGPGAVVEYRTGHAYNVVRSASRSHQRFDLILAGGLFDYLNDRLAGALIRGMEKILAPRGRLLFTNIKVGNPFRVLIEYVGDWFLLERSEEQVRALIPSGIANEGRVETWMDSTGLALFCRYTRTDIAAGLLHNTNEIHFSPRSAES